MRTFLIFVAVLAIAIAVTGCSVATGISGLTSIGGSGSPSATSAPSSTATPSTSKSGTVPTASATPAPSTLTSKPTPSAKASPTPAGSKTTKPNDATVAAIKAVIEKANHEQEEAFAKGDPTLMKDTATAKHYKDMVQINSDLANGGVSAIKLIKIQWGQITLTNSTTARATTYETWQSTYKDGSTDQSRNQNVYTLVDQKGSWKIQTDDQPNSNPNLPPGSVVSAPSGSGAPASVPPVLSEPATQASVSRNWSGYAATSGTFTRVTGSWTVPQSNSTGGLSSGATWVGIGGVRSRDLIQAGTQETTNGSGTVRYDAWIETLPRPSHQVPFTASPGDSVTVTISDQGSNRWLIQFENHTTGESYKTTVNYASSLSSAEWIEEAPSVGRRVVPIDNFGTVQFSGGSAVENGKTVTIAQAGAKPITLAGSGRSTVVTPSVLTPDGQGFTVTQSAPTMPTRVPRGFGM